MNPWLWLQFLVRFTLAQNFLWGLLQGRSSMPEVSLELHFGVSKRSSFVILFSNLFFKFGCYAGFAPLFDHKTSVFCCCCKVWKVPCSVVVVVQRCNAFHIFKTKRKKQNKTESRKATNIMICW